MRARLVGTILLRESGRAYEVWDSQPFQHGGDQTALAEIRQLLEAGGVAVVPPRYQLVPVGQAPRTSGL
jgi:hypothetical protein